MLEENSKKRITLINILDDEKAEIVRGFTQEKIKEVHSTTQKIIQLGHRWSTVVIIYIREYRATMEEEILHNPSSGIT